jgi:hypothetical protein
LRRYKKMPGKKLFGISLFWYRNFVWLLVYRMPVKHIPNQTVEIALGNNTMRHSFFQRYPALVLPYDQLVLREDYELPVELPIISTIRENGQDRRTHPKSTEGHNNNNNNNFLHLIVPVH